MIKNKYIPESYEHFENSYDVLKSEWLIINIDATAEDFNIFYRDIIIQNKHLIPEFTYLKLEAFFNNSVFKFLDNFLTDFHRDKIFVSNQPATQIGDAFINKWLDGDQNKLRLIKYIVDEFRDKFITKRITELTLFNQLYKYLNKNNHNKTESGLSKTDYIKFVADNFDFQYENSDIRPSELEKYMNWFAILESQFYKNK